MTSFGNFGHYIRVKHTPFFTFWDKTDDSKTLVVATHGIFKKTQKTPPKEIKKADEIRKQYLDNKKK